MSTCVDHPNGDCSVCTRCGKKTDTRFGICFACDAKASEKLCEERGFHEPFHDRRTGLLTVCMWCNASFAP